MILIHIRLATESDSKEIFKWRNDSLTRKMSLNTNFVNWEEHNIWIKESLKNTNKILLICENQSNEKISFIKLEVKNNEALISINLSPIHRGKGLSQLCINSAIFYISNYFKNLNFLKAQIKEINIVSKKIFLNSGFKLYNTHNGLNYYRKRI